MISSIVTQVCGSLGSIFTGPLSFLGDIFGQACAAVVQLLQSLGL